MKQRIAVMVPFYRADRWFPEALASVLAQTRVPDEIIIVDDGSPAGESRSLENLPAGVRLIRLARNSGIGAARQAGTAAATAEIVAYLDADDWWEPDHLAAAEALLHRYPTAPGAYTDIAKRYLDGRRIECSDKPAMLDVREAIVRSHILTCGLIVRRAAIESIGGWRQDPMVVEDWDFEVRLLDACGSIPLVPGLVANYRVGNPESTNAQHWLTLRKWRRTLKLNREIVERHFGRGAPRRRWAQAFADRKHRAGGLRGFGYGIVARALGPPLREEYAL
ncbi:MAG: glycosyltransferase family 2 protein [Gemmatimonadales bacterium]